MKKLVTIVFLSAALVVLLIIMAFIYIDMSGHQAFQYDVLKDDKPFGSVKVDRYVTEDKVVYKSTADYPKTTGYTAINEKLFLKKRTGTPLKFVKEANGVRGQKRLTLLVQDGVKTDYLFMEHPRFITLKDFETGEKTMIFSPDDLMLYMPVMAKYNYWKKGSQYFEVMIPMEKAIAPMRDKLEVRYLQDEYIPIMGRRVEAESFSTSAKGIPEAKIILSKYGHSILGLELPKENMKYVLTGYSSGPGKRIRPLYKVFSLLIEKFKDITGLSRAEKVLKDEVAKPMVSPVKEVREDEKEPAAVFFESDNMILSGRLWVPVGKGPFPAVLLVPREGPMVGGEKELLDSIGEALSDAGNIAFIFDSPGQGKSQGGFIGLDDGKRIRIIEAAVSFLAENPFVKNDSIDILGHEGGGYLGLRATLMLPAVRSCIILGLPDSFEKTVLSHEGPPLLELQALLNEYGYGPFAEDYMETVSMLVREHLKNVSRAEEPVAFFMGITVPFKEYKDFIKRKPYETMLSFDRPLLLIVGRDDRNFDPSRVEDLKRALKEVDRHNKVVIFRDLGPYMGKMEERSGSWIFAINSDVRSLILDWVAKSGVSKERVQTDITVPGTKTETDPASE